MTNRDYLRGLSNEKLAELLDEDIICDKICDCMIKTCPDGSCTKCVTKWLEAERKPKKEINERWWKSLFHNQWLGWPMMN